MAFTAKDVQALREKSGCGMMDCKNALKEADGDMEKAVEILREKGLSAATKKAGRIAAEGLVAAVVDDNKKLGVIVEINSETDFVAKNADFAAFVTTVANTVMYENPADVDALTECTAYGTGVKVADLLREKIQTIGENIKIRRFVRYEGDVVAYIHGGGRIGVMVKFDVDAAVAAKDEFKSMGADVAMQVAAASPLYMASGEVPSDVIDKEKEILTAQAINEGKPANIAEKMVAGRINKFYKEICLLEQPFVKDGDISVKQYIENTAKSLGGNIKAVSFVRFERGEGLEKREDNFADEVAGMVK